MQTELIVAGMSLLGTLAGTFAGVYVTGSLTQYRIRQLEEKVNKHNNLVERMYGAEQKITVLDERVRVANHRIEDLEREEMYEHEHQSAD